MIVASRANYKEGGRLYPEVQHIREISYEIALKICELADKEGLATRSPPRGMGWSEYIQSIMWNPAWYQTTVPV
jgi:malic enzyme